MNRFLEYDALDVVLRMDMEYFRDKRILITGATGLLGTNFVASLAMMNMDFRCTITFNSKLEKHFIEIIDERFQLVKGDLTSNEVTDFLEDESYDCIIHCATYGQPALIFDKSQFKNQLKTVQLNTSVLINLFSLLKKDGKFLFISTSEVYQGLTGEHKEHEIGTTNTTHPRACYIEAKRCGEAICDIYRKQGYDVKIIRLCLGYGSGIKKTDTRALNTFIYEGLVKGKIDLLDSGSAIRAYCYVSDVIYMALNILINGQDFIYNVGSTEKTTIKQLAERIGLILDVPVNIPSENKEITGAVNCVALNLDKYISEFGEYKFISLKYGLERIIGWWKFLLDK